MKICECSERRHAFSLVAVFEEGEEDVDLESLSILTAHGIAERSEERFDECTGRRNYTACLSTFTCPRFQIAGTALVQTTRRRNTN